jgi:ABC-type sugar transport system ATPase subunit
VTVEAGEVVALSGPSGSGKSTLMACLAGTDEPSGGTVWLQGDRISGRSEADRAARRARHIGMMAQSGNLVPHLTLAGNVQFARQEFDLLCRLAADAVRAVTREALMDDVWDKNWFGSTKTLDVHIAALRQHISDKDGSGTPPIRLPKITTLRHHGYRLDFPN